MRPTDTPLSPIERLEAACADVWPALVERPLGQWRMRAAGGFTGRANSTLVLGDPGCPLPDALRTVTAFAQENGIPPRLQAPAGAAVEPGLTAAGWQRAIGHSGPDGVLVMTGPLAALTADVAPNVTITTKSPDAAWWQVVEGTPTPSPAERHVLTASPHAAFGHATIDGQTVGAVRIAAIDDLMHIARLAVHPDHRRHGLARALLTAAAAWAAERNAHHYVLQVTAHNTAALNLYEGLAATEHHRYHYWTPTSPT